MTKTSEPLAYSDQGFRGSSGLDKTRDHAHDIAAPARDEDYQAFEGFFAQLSVPDPVPAQEYWRSAMLPTARFLEVDGAPLGYAFVEVTPPQAYVRHVVVERGARGRGLGTSS